MSYPVLSVLDDLKAALAAESMVILEAPPGAGKSTVLPLHLLDEPWLAGRKVVMLEPRRLAARSVAMRMADLLDDDVGKKVGYRVRFENKASASTQLVVVTEGILTRMIQNDNALEEVGLILFDEFHERNLHADLAFALARQIQQVLRHDLRILVMSATLDGDRLAEAFRAPVIRAKGRQYPVDIRYVREDESDPISTRVARAIRKASREQGGDILAFLPGTADIHRTASLLENDGVPLDVYPLYGDLDFKRQQAAIVPNASGRRKVVLATSIAETSLTIEGITTVIDSGYARVPQFDPRSGFTRLQTVKVTLDAANQRAGRAGRLGPGVCYRLWSEGAHLLAHRTPEILAADLAPMMLELYAWGVRNPDELDWVTPPPQGAVSQAVDLLEQLGAVNHGVITMRGREILRLPTHPRIAHMLLEARNSNEADALCVATDVAALLEERDPLADKNTVDLTMRIEELRRWRRSGKIQGPFDRIERLAASWRRVFDIEMNNDPVADTTVGRWLMTAYPERIARRMEKNGERYKMANGRIGKLPNHDPLHRHTWIAIAHLDARLHEDRVFLAAPVDETDIRLMGKSSIRVFWDTEREMVVAQEEDRLGPLLISSRPVQEIPSDEKIAVICDAIRQQGLSFFGDSQKGWQARVMSLRSWRPAEPWPNVSDEALLDTLEVWLGPFIQSHYKRSELLKLDLIAMLNTLLPWELSTRLDELAPTRLPVPSGSLIALRYFEDGSPPVMEVRLQEVFGWVDTPSVNEGRNKIVLHLLSPGFKPVQVTQDLRSFWTNTYAEVRKELRTRYPKHSWPEDPLTAEAVRGARRKY